MIKAKFLALAIVAVSAAAAFGQGSYKQPPKDILDVLNSTPIPTTSVSPSRDMIAM